jgi:predicted amidophosphoribosyltransferase
MEFRCPYCNSPIYSRKNKICGVCEKPLPKELLLTDEQIALLKKQTDAEEKRAKEFISQITDLTRSSSDGSGIGGII